MAGYVLHMIHGCETFLHLSNSTRVKMPHNALRKFLIGTISPDLVTREQKHMTHFYKEAEKEKAYYVPDMNKAEGLFLKKEPTHLGVLTHLKCDFDFVNNVLFKYAKPCENGEFKNTETGETMTRLELFGNGKEIRGQLYELYDKFNAELAIRYMAKFNHVFGLSFAENKMGFLGFVNWLFPGGIPMCGIAEMDDYRMIYDINEVLKSEFNHDGRNCNLNIEIVNITKVIRKSAIELAKQIDILYLRRIHYSS